MVVSFIFTFPLLLSACASGAAGSSWFDLSSRVADRRCRSGDQGRLPMHPDAWTTNDGMDRATHPLPAEVLVLAGRDAVVRRPWTQQSLPRATHASVQKP